MSFQLRYDIGVAGQDKVARALRGIESEVKASATRTERQATSARRSQMGLADREAKARARAEESLQRQRSQALLRQHQDAMRLAKREEAERTRGIRRIYEEEKRAHRRAMSDFDRDRRRSEVTRRRQAEGRSRMLAGGAIRGTSNVISGAARFAGTGAALFGGLAAGNAINDEIQVRAAASRLANQAGDPSLKGQLAAEAKSVRGFTGVEALSGIEAFVTKTGDLEAARGLIQDLGTVALATGTDLGDLGSTAGQAFNVLKDQLGSGAAAISEVKSLIGVLAQQGAMGAVEIKDLAKDFGKLGAATRAFEGGSPALLRTMGAFAQIAVARGGAESSADASTAAMRMSADIVTNRKKFAALPGGGVDIKSKTDPTKLRDPVEIIADVLAKTGGDIEKTSGLFGMESRKIFAGLSPVFTDAEKRKKGSGRAAVMAEVSRFAGAEATPAQMKARAQSRLQDEDMRLKESLKRFNDEVGTRLVPALTDAIPHFERMIPAIAGAADKLVEWGTWIADNPWKALGSVVALSIGKEIAAAAIPSLIARAFAGTLAGGAASSGAAALGGAAAGGLRGRLASAGAVGAVVLATGAALSHLDDASSAGDPAAKAHQARRDLMDGKLSDDDKRKRLAELQGALGKEQSSSPGLMMQASGAVSSMLGGMSADEGKAFNIEALHTAIAELTAALSQQSGAAEGAAMAMENAAGKLSTIPDPARTVSMLAR